MQQMIITKILLKQTNCLRIFLFQIALDLKKKKAKCIFINFSKLVGKK